MDLTIGRDIFLTPLTKVVGISQHNLVMPALSNVLVKFQKEKVSFTATDLGITAIAEAECGCGEEVTILVNAKKLTDIFSIMEPGDVKMETSQKMLMLKQHQLEFELALQNIDEFPTIEAMESGVLFKIDGASLSEMMERVVFAISRDETRMNMTGMYLAGEEGSLVTAGTDGFRLAVRTRKEFGTEFPGVIIPKRTVQDVLKSVEANDEVQITVGETRVQFRIPFFTLISRLISGPYVNFKDRIPRDNPNYVKIEAEKFVKALRRVSTLIDKGNILRVKLNGTMTLEAESEIGRAQEVLEVGYTGDPLGLSFNARFLLEALPHLKEKVVEMKLASSFGPALIEEPDYTNIIMPIKE